MSTRMALNRLSAEIDGHLKAANEIANAAQAAGRDLTADEQEAAQHHLDRAKELGPRLKALKARTDDEAALRKQMDDLLGGVHKMPDDGYRHGGGVKAHPGARWADAVVRQHTDSFGRFKSLTPSGTVLVAVPAPEPVRLGAPVATLRQLIPNEPTAGAYAFLRQTVRTNNAAPVAAGALKPTSVYTTELVQDRARTLAHLSESLNRADLADAPRLQDFVQSEMFYGLERAVEDQILNGSGVGENLTGLASTSGIQTQAYATSLVVTTRKAQTKLEQQGLVGTGWVLNPADWEAIELSATTTGSLLVTEAGQQAPVESSSRRLWGAPVVTSPSCPAGVGYLADWAGSTRLYVREDARLDWSENTYDPDALGAGVGASDFERNLIRFRAEGRFGFGVLRPSGIVQVDLTA